MLRTLRLEQREGGETVSMCGKSVTTNPVPL